MTHNTVDYRAVIRELLAIWAAQNKQTVITRTDLHDASVPVLVRGLTAHAVDCAGGVLTLYQNHQPVPAIPVVRALMEDATSAIWLIVDEKAWKSFIGFGAVTRRKALNSLLQLDPSDLLVADRLAETDDILDRLGSPSGYKIDQRMMKIEGAENWYLMYRAMSAMTHADSGVVDLYTAHNPENPLGVAFRNHAAFSNANSYIGVAATMLLLTLIAWDTCQSDHPDHERLTAIATDLGVQSSFSLRH
ncbi:hypothetical protein SAMN06295974_1928 [Plantibacter flavus]|uniref:Uncharacterized protein n=1 Tax=Plantibacter flavus TaxID=150123 RepID=A0A3N2BXN0_9MICO|nr:DUF5677 domain-containing protein [Plantibacter flavus]ROR80033.1 hypothetical protein EDD42_0065 [Plantibacter flavus]SMG28833.1 hypothetical protein SAMN06295974_1928 [Plantibacter flavus]